MAENEMMDMEEPSILKKDMEVLTEELMKMHHIDPNLYI